MSTPPLTASTSPLPDGSGSGDGTLDASTLPASSVQWGFADTVQHPEATAGHDDPPRPKPRAGRRPGAVWAYFTPLRTEQNKTHAVCRFCTRRCAGVAARMITHLLHKCPSVPTDERDTLTAALKQDQPPEKRRRVDTNGASQSGLAAFETTTNSESGGNDDKELNDALQQVAVACLRVHAPLSLVEDAFFRDALALLRPQSIALIKKTDAAMLRESIRALQSEETTEWMNSSACVTLIYNAAKHEWRGADDKRRFALLGEATDAWHTEVETHLETVGSDSIIGLCYGTYVLATTDAPVDRVKLMAKCLLKETARLWALIVDAVPHLVDVVVNATEAAQTDALMTLPTTSDQPPSTDGAPLTFQDLSSTEWSLPFRILKRLDALGQSLQQIEADASRLGVRMGFWKDLTAVDVLLSPLAWVYVLCESKNVCSSEVVVCWLWLLATIETSTLIDTGICQSLVDSALAMMIQSLEDHHLVALLLDPRTRGAGLSATGRRKVKTLVAHVAARLWPAKFEVPLTKTDESNASLARQALLTQLGHYLDKTACFGDEVVWEMAQGAAPERFWRDYVDDAPELTAVATAVLSFVPIASQTSELLDAAHETVQEQFDTRQIRFHFERNRKNGEYDMSTVLMTYAELIASSPRQATSTSLPSWNVAEAVRATLTRLRVAGESQTLEAPTTLVRDVDATWFAFQSESQHREIDAARRSLVPPMLPPASTSTVAV